MGLDLLASRRFKGYLRTTKGGWLHIDRGAVADAAKYDGKWVIETNDDTISLEDATCGYKSLMVIERCFRSLKRTQIKMTPMYHWASRRIETHVKICVLASCGKSWYHIKKTLETLQVSEFFDLKYRVLMRNEVTQKVVNIFKSLNIKSPPRVIDMSEQGQNP